MENHGILKEIDFKKLKEIYNIEYTRAQKMLARNKQAIIDLNFRMKKGEIKIPKEIDNNDFNRYLKDWDRHELNSYSE
jgi:hypothetical protein